MVALETPICDFGWNAPDFDLIGTDGKNYQYGDIKGPNGTLVMFICNHCPYVIHYHDEIKKLNNDFGHKVDFVAISSNDIVSYPQDGPAEMKALFHDLNLSFPYLLDETQEIARELQAECTPEFYLYDNSSLLVYRGRMDDSSPGNDINASAKDLRKAMTSLLDGKSVSSDQQPSMGCNIKWK